jgi:peptidyl-prolyl cis-trans isomerase A (cyclophilin A)
VKAFLVQLCMVLTLALIPVALEAQATTPAATAAKPATTAHHTTTAAAHTDPALLHPAMLKAQAPPEFTVKFTTTAGDFDVQVTRAWAPLGADRFYNLVKHGYFTNAAFFRVVPGFVVQFGLSANPAVNKAWEDAKISDDPVTQSNHPGFLTFATSGPNTRTTQLFINLGDNPRLDGMGFAPFGQITAGMDTVQKIYSAYGEQPEQGEITEKGKAYLDKNFPKLDRIVSALITSPAPAAPVHHAAPATKKPTPAAPTSND